MSRRRAVLLINETARRAASSRVRELLAARLAPAYEIHHAAPHSGSDTESMARAAAGEGAELVVVAGGDGTINAAANGLQGTGTMMGIVPLGTANDLARELGVPTNPTQAIEVITRGRVRVIDFVLVNGRGFCTVGGIGLITRSTDAATRAKSRRGIGALSARVAGSSIYRMVTARELLTPGPLTTRAELQLVDPEGGETTTATCAHAIFVTNHRTLGGGIRLPVESRGDDGVFEIVAVRESARARLLLNFARLSTGVALPPGALQIHRVRSARIRTEAQETFVADGESLAMADRFEIGIAPRSLSILV